jgi:SAM-dependent MidA family methyltransferase
MAVSVDLPPPSSSALEVSAELTRVIRAEIRSAGGWLDFSRYMELVLYTPGLGYYSAGSAKLGPSGDFVTAPELSGLLGRALART